ncbi:hypothetical protein D9758_004629 [Tetrapyrgos nigripes]|uniref:AB hydrolase-1 domain-containing protein n=1 Tax=Tetrapyrgos nigripes TaxID=182062 RepID=A0A8H5LYM4_9AGAR|nr:hypothetical protein D9758_004629 [Tetrapyrgos nigripes]
MRTSARLPLLCSCLPLILLTAAEHVYSGFNPRAYEKRSVSCKAVRRDQGDAVVDISLTYVDINPNASKTLIMVHGWPGLWSSWAYQIQEFKVVCVSVVCRGCSDELLQDDYHLIIPDLRGFGESGHPGDVKSSGTLFDMVGDLTCILEDAGVEKAVCVGHDWGSSVCYEAARSRPDVFEGVVGGVVPYIPFVGNFTPISYLVPLLPRLTYQLFFDKQTPQAVEELNHDIRRTLRSTLRMKTSPPPDDFLKSKDSFLDAWKEYEEIPPVPFLDKDEEDYFVESYEKSGFDNTLQFYTDENRYASWKFAHDQGNFTISQPDPVADWAVASKLLKSADYLDNLTTKMIQGSHWVHLEHADLFNTEMKKWLEEYFPATAPAISDHANPEKTLHEEL